MNKNAILIIVAALIILGVGAYFFIEFYQNREIVEQKYVPVYMDVDGQMVEVKMPDLNRDISKFNVSDSVKSKIADEAKKLRADNQAYDSWIELGLLYSSIGDTEGTVEAWEYAGKLRPENTLWAINMASHYAYVEQDKIKSIEYIRKAIEINKNNPYAYFRGVEIYMDLHKDKAAAIALTEEGLKNNPGDIDLAQLLKQLKQQ